MNGVSNIIDDCERDDFLNFSANGTYTWDPATIKCDESDTSFMGTWSLSSDEKTMIVDGDTVTLLK